MASLAVALGAELLKIRRTLMLMLALLSPLLLGVQEVAVSWERVRSGVAPYDGSWVNQAQTMMLLWNLMLLPLLIPLQTALLAGVEHSSRGWKRLFATPVPRWTVYMAKLIVSMGLFGLSMVLLDVTIVLAGMLLNAMAPALGLTFDTIPWRVLLEATARAYLASWLFIALHTWIACRWPSFVLAMGVGIAATAAGMVVWSSDYGLYYPWTIPWLTSHAAYQEGGHLVSLTIGCLGAVPIALLGCWDVTHRDALGAL